VGDSQIARLVGSLRQTNRWDQCVLALTADHGEEFLEHGGRYHAPLRLNEEIVRVPVLIRVPGEARSEGAWGEASSVSDEPSAPGAHSA